MNYSLRLAFLFAIPSAVGLHLLSKPIVSMLFQRGQFNQVAADATAGALAIFAYQIPFVSGVRNLVPGFFALRDAKTPVIISAIAVIVNGVCAYFLMHRLLHLGLALALVISSITNFTILFFCFRRKVGIIGGRKLFISIFKTSFASAVMAAAILLGEHYLGKAVSNVLWQKALLILILISIGTAVFVLITKLINAEEYQSLVNLFMRRRKS